MQQDDSSFPSQIEQVMLCSLSSLVHKSNFALTDLCLCALKGWRSNSHCALSKLLFSIYFHNSRLPARGKTGTWICKNGCFVQPHSWQQEAEKLEWWSKSLPFSPCLLFLPSASPSVLRLSLDSRLGGRQPQCWTVLLGLVVEAGNWVYSAMEKSFICACCDAGGPASTLLTRDSDFWVECFGNEGEAQGCVVGELLLYSLVLPLIISLPLKEKKKWEETAKGADTEEGIKTKVGEN